MAINPAILQGPVTRSQDFTTIKHNEDTRGMVEQINIQRQFKQEVEDKAHQVQEGDDANGVKKDFDAKEKGDGQYSGDGGKNRKKNQKEQSDGKVIIKGQVSFDMKI